MPRRTVADALGALILFASGTLSGAFPALAETECKSPAAWASPDLHLVGFNAPQFVKVLASISRGPAPPQIDGAKLVVAYIPPDDSQVRLRFFDAQGCDLGVWTQIPLAVLHYIDSAIGLPA